MIHVHIIHKSFTLCVFHCLVNSCNVEKDNDNERVFDLLSDKKDLKNKWCCKHLNVFLKLLEISVFLKLTTADFTYLEFLLLEQN